jgi:hypothetical protein
LTRDLVEQRSQLIMQHLASNHEELMLKLSEMNENILMVR